MKLNSTPRNWKASPGQPIGLRPRLNMREPGDSYNNVNWSKRNWSSEGDSWSSNDQLDFKVCMINNSKNGKIDLGNLDWPSLRTSFDSLSDIIHLANKRG